MKIIYCLALLLSSCCSTSYLTVQTDFLSQKNLASSYVRTPDPRQFYPNIGERLIISWAVPKKLLCYDDFQLKVTIRFRNREEIVEVYSIDKMRGTYVFSLINDNYLVAGGILTYKIDLIGGGYIFEEWRHQIYAELIEIGHDINLSPQNTDLLNSEDSQGDYLDNYLEDYPIDWDD